MLYVGMGEYQANYRYRYNIVYFLSTTKLPLFDLIILEMIGYGSIFSDYLINHN